MCTLYDLGTLQTCFAPEACLGPWVISPLKKSRWWFQICFMFTPIWGRFQFWLIFFKWVGSTTVKVTPPPASSPQDGSHLDILELLIDIDSRIFFWKTRILLSRLGKSVFSCRVRCSRWWCQRYFCSISFIFTLKFGGKRILLVDLRYHLSRFTSVFVWDGLQSYPATLSYFLRSMQVWDAPRLSKSHKTWKDSSRSPAT